MNDHDHTASLEPDQGGVQQLAGSTPPGAADASFRSTVDTVDDAEARRGKEEEDSLLRSHARVVFEPWTGECPLPTNEQWAKLADPYLISLRIAWSIGVKNKPELVTMVAQALFNGDVFEGTDFVTSVLTRLDYAEGFFNDLAEVAKDAASRLQSAAAVVALRDRGIEPEESTSVSRLALHAYNEWLFMERRLLNVELYGRENARRMEGGIMHTAADSFHFPMEEGRTWQDVPPPSSRAEAILSMLDIDWRVDGWREAERARAAEDLYDRAQRGEFYTGDVPVRDVA